MDLSLHGSQINLTVRDKPPTPPAVQYPPSPTPSLQSHQHHQHQRLAAAPTTRRRPVSASHPRGLNDDGPSFGGGSNRFSAARSSAQLSTSATSFVNDPPHRRRPRMRPVSADISTQPPRFEAGTRTQPQSLKTTADGLSTQLHNATSSSNILNLLLAEPIQKKSPSMSSTPWNRMSSPRREDDDGENSVEEYIVSNCTTTDDEVVTGIGALAEPAKLPSCVSVAQSSRTFNRLAQTNGASTNTTKKYVTFSNDPEIVVRPEPALGVDNGAGSSKKPDLPGRVSFSTSDVFEVDFSDADGDQTPRKFESASTAVDSNSTTLNNGNIDGRKGAEASAEEPLPSQAMRNECNNRPSSSCCSLNCNNLSTIPNTTHTSPKKVSNNISATEFPDESDEIIAEYRREIAKLNRNHEQTIGRICSDNLSDISSTSGIQLHPKIINKPDATELPKPKNTNDNEPPEQAENVSTVLENPIIIDTSSVVINNYLKTTKHLPAIVTSNANNKTTKKSSNIIASQNTVPPKKPTASTKPNRAVSAAAAKSEREDSRLNEFQLDKVESWMSIHKFADDTVAKDAAHVTKDLDAVSPVYVSSVRRDTPNSKTDDEGMYSYDEQPDGDGSSTYEEIASVLREIEEAKDADQSGDGGKACAPSCFQKRDIHDVPKTNGSVESPDKMREILAYLDGVETSCDQTMQDTYAGNIPDSFRSNIEFAVEPDIIGDMPKIGDLITLPNQQLARRVIALSLRANELASAIQLSREHMASVRTEKVRTVRAEKQTAATRLADQKRHFESVVQRHQAFIEQLLKDKTALADKVAAMNRRLDSQNQAWQHKLDTELIRIKETTLAGEKIRRERWVRENTKKIKELTVKGLELEINQMTGSHQAQITELRSQYQRDLQQAVEEERQRHEQLENGIRAAYALDREGAIEKERNAIRERFERQIADEQHSFEQQKSRMLADFSAEKQRLQDALHNAELASERRRHALDEERKDAVAAVQAELSVRMSAVEKKHQTELQSLQQQYEADFKIWRREHETAAKLRETERENCLRREAHLERDRQIDGIVAKLDAENLKKDQELDHKLSRLQDKHTHELQQLELAESTARVKYADCRTKLAESEAAREIAQVTAKQYEMQLQHIQQLYDGQLSERDTLKESARRDVQLELVTLRKERDTEIERIYARVQQAVERKDATVEVLHKENAALKERCVKLEAVVRQQRQDYFVK